MTNDAIIHCLGKLPFKVPSFAATEIQNFLSQQVGLLTPLAPQLIYAALGFLSEHSLLQDEKLGGVTCGPTIEEILGVLSPEQVVGFMNGLTIIGQKIRWTNLLIQWKISNLPLSYGLFSKAQAILSELSGLLPNNSLSADLRAIIWVFYLWAKQCSQIELDISEQITILQASLTLFVESLTSGSLLQILFERYFPKCVSKGEMDYNRYLQQILEEVVPVGQLPAVLGNQVDRKRLFEELVRKYDAVRILSAAACWIDEIQYLGRGAQEKTPAEVHSSSKISNTTNSDSHQISGQASDTLQLAPKPTHPIPRPQKISPFFNRPSVRLLDLSPLQVPTHMTPLTKNLTNSEWLNHQAEILNADKKQELVELFSQVGDQYLEQMRANSKKYLTKVVKTYSRERRNLQAKVNKIQEIYEYFLWALCKCYTKQQSLRMIGSYLYLLNLLCLTTAVYFYSNQIQSGDFRQFAQNFDCCYIDIFRLINKFAKFDPTMPENIRSYLNNLQKQILIIFIWQDGKGYQFLTNTKPTEWERGLLIRLQKQLYDRLFSLHHLLSLSHSQIARIKSIVTYILTNKPKILERNMLDQIIICSVFAVLKINRQEVTLQEIFEKYLTLDLSYNEMKFKVFDNTGEEVSLLKWYNEVFRTLIDEALKDQHNNKKIIATPLREDLQKQAQSGKFNILDRLPDNPTFYHKAKLDFSSTKKEESYQSRLRKKIIILTPNKVKKPIEDEPGGHTPVFPGLNMNKQFSFGMVDEDGSIAEHQSMDLRKRAESTITLMNKEDPNDKQSA